MKRGSPPPELLLTKLSAPRISGDIVARPRLYARLSAGLDKPLTLVSAGAGFGKTTTLAAWLAELGCPGAWVLLDRTESDLLTFVNYFVAAIRSLFPDACEHTRALLKVPGAPATSALVLALSNDLEAIEQGTDCAHFVVVFDDYHLAASGAVNDFLAELLRHPAHKLHLVLSTRSDPSMPLSQWRANGQMTEIRGTDLRFSAKEATEFLDKALGAPLDSPSVARLLERTEGWAAGLRLAVLSLVHSEHRVDELVSMEGSDRYLIDYLLSEVLANLPAGYEQFLLETSILDRLTGSLCDAVSGAEPSVLSGQARLEWLAQANLFTFSGDAQGRWYRYHHLFQSMLADRLRRSCGAEQINALHSRASAWYDANGYINEAITHALKAGDEAGAATLVQAHRHEILNYERWHQIEGWLSLFSPQALDARPELLLAQASLAGSNNSIQETSRHLKRLEEIVQPESLPALARGEYEMLCGLVAFYALDPEHGLPCTERALATLPLNFSWARAFARVFQGGHLFLKGEANAAITSLYEGLAEDRQHGNTYRTRLLLALATLYWFTGDMADLALMGQELLSVATERSLLESIGRGHYYQGMAAYQRNDLAAAAEHFAANLVQPEVHYPVVYIGSGFGLATIYQIQGRADMATATTEVITSYAMKRNNPEMLPDVLAHRARLAMLQGRIAEAGQWAAAQSDQIRRGPLLKLREAQVTLGEILLAQGTPESLRRAADLLPRLHEFVASTYNTRYLVEVLALEALLDEARGKHAAALASLEQAVTLAQPGGMLRVFADLGPKLTPLFQQLRTQGVAPGYIDAVLLAFAPSATGPKPDQHGLIEPLTERELEVLTLLSDRYSNKEIANSLSISTMTVKRHASNIYGKLAVENRQQAVAKASALGIITPAPRAQH
jgi:LuxR family transcriptional regulator, maltose regulon positive regulatory protein